MTSDIRFYTSNGSYEVHVNVTDIMWQLDPGIIQLQPATFAMLRTVFQDRLVPNMLIFFGKYSEKVVFEVNFPTDASWYSFRTFAKNSAYFSGKASQGGKYAAVEWGSTGDTFNGTWDNTTIDGLGTGSNNPGWGFFGPINVHKKIPSNTWEGTVTWYFGRLL